MWKFENIFIGFIALVCAVYMFLSAQMKMGTITQPGPGFVPVILGSIGLLVSLILLITNLKKGGKEQAEKMDREAKARFFGYLIASIVFIPMLEFLGTIIAIFILVLALAKLSGAKGWVYPILFAAICSAAFYGVFDIALGVSLPKGIFN